MNIKYEDVANALKKAHYVSNEKINTSIYVSLICDKPIIIEGEPGVGKTAVAIALGKGLEIPVIRVQMYEGLTADQILYDYDYQKQLLTLEAVRPKIEETYKNQSLQETTKNVIKDIDFYGDDFLIDRPILKSIRMPGKKILLIDEIDKAPEEIEYMLYEFLENNSISIPQYGKIECPPENKPIVFLTSNNYRELSGALKRRCNYIFIKKKTEKEMMEILMEKSNADEKLAQSIAKCLMKMQNSNLRQIPSISEGIEFADCLAKSKELTTKEFVLNSIGILCKNNQDEKFVTKIIDKDGEELWA